MNIACKIGFGPKVKGEIVVLPPDFSLGKEETLTTRLLTADMSGKILILLTSAPREFLEKACFLGVLGIVVPSIHFRDYEYFRKRPDFSLLVMMKFGKLVFPKEISDKLEKTAGREAELSGEEKALII